MFHEYCRFLDINSDRVFNPTGLFDGRRDRLTVGVLTSYLSRRGGLGGRNRWWAVVKCDPLLVAVYAGSGVDGSDLPEDRKELLAEIPDRL